MLKFKNAIIFVEGMRDIFHAKTAPSLLRFKGDSVCCLIDSNKVGVTAEQVFKIGGKIPFYSNVEEAYNKSTVKPDKLILGLMLPDGKIPDLWLSSLVFALKNKIDILNPFHINLGDIIELANALGGVSSNSTEQITRFNNANANVINVRIPPDDIELFSHKIFKTKTKRILTVGSDCNVGKMVTSLELTKYAKQANYKAEFIATGQIAMLIKGSGIAIDRVISDFVPGAVEKLVLEEQDNDLVFIEGQGSLFQPMYSPVTLGLVHGGAPNAMILCHVPSREFLRYSTLKIPSYKRLIDYYEDTASIVVPTSKVCGIALNCFDMDDASAQKLIKQVEEQTGLPVTDPVKFGVKNIFDNLIKHI